MRRTIWLLVGLALILTCRAALAAERVIAAVPPPDAHETVLYGRKWHYAVGFEVDNSSTIGKLIQCESQGVNIARPDSNGLPSYGILQFNGTSTWDEAEARFGFQGSPMVPADAIHMADMMIDAGMLDRWTCARILQLKLGMRDSIASAAS
jgi:hypothetical protein